MLPISPGLPSCTCGSVPSATAPRQPALARTNTPTTPRPCMLLCNTAYRPSNRAPCPPWASCWVAAEHFLKYVCAFPLSFPLPSQKKRNTQAQALESGGRTQALWRGVGPRARASSTMGLSTPLLEKDEADGGCAGHSQPSRDDGITRDTAQHCWQQTRSKAKEFEERAREQNHPSHADAHRAPAPVTCGQQAPQTSRPPMSCLSCALHALPRCPQAQNSAAAAAPHARARLAQLQPRSSR